MEKLASHLDYLFYWEQQQPNKTYLVQPIANGSVVKYTWQEVAHQVRLMASHLQTLNFPPRSNIAIYGKNSAHWIIADLAIWLAGHVSVPLYSTLNAEGAKYVLEHSEAKLLFIGKLDGLADSWHSVKTILTDDLPCICLPLAPDYAAPTWDEIIKNTALSAHLDLPQRDDLATIVYTSGSTGLPKGVMQNFSSLTEPPHSLSNFFHVTSAERTLSYLPLAHVAERIFIESSSLVMGFTVFFANNLETFVDDLNRAKPTIFFSVPRLWTKFYLGINEKIPLNVQNFLFKVPIVGKAVKKKLLAKLGLDQIRFALTGSAPLPVDIIKWYRNLGLELLEIYGMTENCGYSHVTRPGQFLEGYVGHAQTDVQCKIDSNGEILVKSPGMMMGYYKNPAKTAEDLTVEGYLRTGDLGNIDSSGRLRITGRVKDIFKTSKGKYVMPVPIEQKLGNHESIELVCVGGAKLPQPVAFVMLAEDLRQHLAEGTQQQASIEQALKTLLNETNRHLEPHEKLSFIVVINNLWTMENDMLTPTMKIKRNKIEALYENHLDGWAATQKQVVWQV